MNPAEYCMEDHQHGHGVCWNALPGWRCGACGFTTYDGSEILWPPDGRGVSDLVCPQCGAVGEFVDA